VADVEGADHRSPIHMHEMGNVHGALQAQIVFSSSLFRLSKIAFSSSWLFRSSKTSSHYFPKETRGGKKKGQPAMCGGTHRPKSLVTPPPPEEKRSFF